MADTNKKPISWQEARLNLREQYYKPPIILKIDDSVVCTLGNFSASAGKEKSKKTFNVSALTASLLSGKSILNYKPNIPTDRNKVLYIDTEQSNYHCQRVAKRIRELADTGLDELDNRLIFLALRKYTPEQRIGIIEQAIYDNGDVFLVIIDGLRDLVLDINSPSEATKIMTKLLTWTDEMNIHIHCVLHLNKGDDNTRGHLGTELNNKSETILQITKDVQDKNTSIVSAKSIRDMGFDDFAFFINNDALPELAEEYTPADAKPFGYEELSEEQHRQALIKAFEAEEAMGYQSLIDALKESYNSVTGLNMGINKVKKLKSFLQNKRMILKAEKSYRFNHEFKY